MQVMKKLAQEYKPKKEEIVEPIPISKDKNNKIQIKEKKDQSQSVSKKQEKSQFQQLQLQQSRQKSRQKQQPKSEGNLVYCDLSYIMRKIEITTKIHDLVFDQGKKEEKPQNIAKKGDKPPEPEEPKVEIIDFKHIQKDRDDLSEKARPNVISRSILNVNQ
ncbi:unnamed protein product [Paramecium sonneborni]|uniref:Uncharacterized protein n=1 Tax=Paramecium sonneborni TaxID=65129 RepID=A0A8S1RLZ6_9CILI|nr:unnamed protein product [Paramecium sonneborni]